MKQPKISFFPLFLTIFLFSSPFIKAQDSESECNCSTLAGSGNGAFVSTYSGLLGVLGLPAGSSLPSGSITCLKIKGTFTVNVAQTGTSNHFGNMDIYLEPGAEIIVNPGITLVSTSTRYSGCTSMWKSITLNQSSGVRLNNCTIYDSQYGVLSDNKSVSLDIRGTRFINNYHGITLISTTVSPSTIQTNSFSVGTLLPGSPTTNIGVTGTKAAYLSNTRGFLFGGTFNSQNSVQNMNYGIIVSNNSMNTQIFNNSFTNISETAILGDNSAINTFSYNTILQSKRGIDCKLTTGQLFIEGNHIESELECVRSFGHHLSSIDGEEIRVKYSTRLNTQKSDCIKITNTFNSGGIVVQENENVFPGLGTIPSGEIVYGINLSVIQSTFVPLNNIIVSGNKIFLDGSSLRRGGILVSNCDNGNTTLDFLNRNLIYKNEIKTQTLNSARFGIYMVNSPYFLVQENKTWGTGATSGQSTKYMQQGIRVDNCPHTDLVCNDIDHTIRGLIFSMNNESSDVQTTQHGNNKYGMYYEKASTTDDQTHRGNNWSQANTIADGYFVGNSVEAGLNFYKISSNFIRPNSVFVVSQGMPSDWILIEDEEEPICGRTAENGDEVITPTNLFASETPYSTGLSVPKWEAQRSLYEKLQNNPGLYGIDSQVDDFYDWAITNAPGTFHNLDQNMAAAFSASGSTMTNFNSIYTAIRNKIEDRNDLLTLLETANPQDIPDYLADLSVTDHIIDSLHNILITLSAQRDSEISTALGNVLTANNNITSTQTFINNELTINAILLNALTTGNWIFTSGTQTAIEAIAAECPLTGGRGVYTARFLQTFYNNGNNLDFSDTDECIEAGPRSNEDLTANSRESAPHIAPNPASGSFTISFDAPLTMDGGVTLSDVSGRIVFQKVLPSGGQNFLLFPSSSLEGIYFLQIERGKQRKTIQKIVLNNQ